MLPEFECAVDENPSGISKSEEGNKNEHSCADNSSIIARISEVEQGGSDSSEQDSEVEPFLTKSTLVAVLIRC